ncbi:MAG: DUF1549 domain-containing protein, partial [Pirellulaceae bacterium]|nr:DUF1549 domain-containing protein [Pirellulaceae bacterium]
MLGMHQSASVSCFAILAVVLACSCPAVDSDDPDLFVLMHQTGKIERYNYRTGQHMGTLISGLPPANAMVVAPDGCWLISTGLPGQPGKAGQTDENGTVLRFDPRGAGQVTKLIDVPEGYGGRLLRATGLAWYQGDLLVASQADGKVKRYGYPSGQWINDAALATAGSITQIAVHQRHVYIADYAARAVRRTSAQLDGALSDLWAQPMHNPPAPWGVAVDRDGTVYWSAADNQLYRSRASAAASDKPSLAESQALRGSSGHLSTPIGLTIGPDRHLYCANLKGAVNSWRIVDQDQPESSSTETSSLETELVKSFGGPEMQQPICVLFAHEERKSEFVYEGQAGQMETSQKLAFFENHIRPLLHEHCLECHDAETQEGKLRLDHRLGWQQGGQSGSAIVPGQPEQSLLIQAVRHADKDLKMPPDARLSLEDIALLTQWVETGAVDPRAIDPSAIDPSDVATRATRSASDSWDDEFQQRLDWWSLKPLANVEPPMVDDELWGGEPIDRFLLAEMQKHSIVPADPATPEILLRRLSFVLTGLPPTPELRAAYLSRLAAPIRADASTEVDQRGLPSERSEAAYAWLVDQLLQSPHFGERMARHWMDAVRYTDTYGYEWDNPAKGSHEYRDYLIRAFNQDVGYDTLVREQLAGDLLPEPRIDLQMGIHESVIGPMFYHLGEHRHGSSLAFNGIHQEMVNNKVDAFSKVFLATTVSCARCHDHKREAVSQRDYYALGAVFMTPRWVSRPADAPQKNVAAIAKLRGLRDAIRQAMADQWSRASFTSDRLRSIVSSMLKAEKPPQLTLADIAYPLSKLLQENTDGPAVWSSLVEEYRAARAARIEQNGRFEILA